MEHRKYSMSVETEWPREPLFTKREWVPNWLWQLVAYHDSMSAMIVAMRNQRKATENALAQAVHDSGRD